MNLSLLNIDGFMLVVSQFTLHGDTSRGRRPSFIKSALGKDALVFYEYFIAKAKTLVNEVGTGRFGAMMEVELVNDVPVTILIDSESQIKKILPMRILTILLIISAAFVLGCSGAKPGNATKAGNAEVKKGVAPIADPEIAVIEMETPAYGTIKLELYSNIAPKMVARFKELAKEGVYDGVTFHRINESVIQSGDPNSKDADPTNDGQGKSTKPNVDAEFSDILYDTGILGAARGQDNNSANAQFFITLKRESGFDNKYTIFGKVIEGMGNVRTISGVTPKEGERPVEPVRIKSIKIVAK